MHSFEVHTNESACKKSGRLGMDQVICMCCGSSIYGLTVTRDSMVIPWAAIVEIWSPSGVFSWWFEGLLVGSQKEYFGWHMVYI